MTRWQKAKKRIPKNYHNRSSAYWRKNDFKLFSEIAHSNGALILADIAHIGCYIAHINLF